MKMVMTITAAVELLPGSRHDLHDEGFDTFLDLLEIGEQFVAFNEFVPVSVTGEDFEVCNQIGVSLGKGAEGLAGFVTGPIHPASFGNKRPYSGNGVYKIPRKYSLIGELEVRIETFVSEAKGSLESLRGELMLAFGVIAESRGHAFVWGGA